MSGFGGGRGGRGQEWRFPVRSAAVPPSDDVRWSLTPDLRLSLDAMLESLAPLVDLCRKRCEATKRAGRVDAFQLMSARICSLSDRLTVTFPLVSTMARELLEIEEQAAGESTSGLLEVGSDNRSHEAAYPHPPVTPRTATRAHDPNAARQRLNAGWRFADGVHQEQEYIKARMCLAEFNKLRAKEIRLAYVCGFRDALRQLLRWARSHLTREAAIPTPQLNEYLVNCATSECEGLQDGGGGVACSSSSRMMEASKLDANMRPLPITPAALHDRTPPSPRRQWRAARPKGGIDAFTKFAQLWRGKQNARETRGCPTPESTKSKSDSGTAGNINEGGHGVSCWPIPRPDGRVQPTGLPQGRQELKRDQRGDEDEDDEENDPHATARKSVSTPGGRAWAGSGSTGARRLLRQRKVMMVTEEQRASPGDAAQTATTNTTTTTPSTATLSVGGTSAPGLLRGAAPSPFPSSLASKPHPPAAGQALWGKPLLRVTHAALPSDGEGSIEANLTPSATQASVHNDINHLEGSGEGNGGSGHDMQL